MNPTYTVSSASPRKDRWTELELRSIADEADAYSYELEVRGHSRRPGETTRRDVTFCLSEEDVVAALRHPVSGEFSLLACQLLDLASEEDEWIRNAWVPCS